MGPIHREEFDSAILCIVDMAVTDFDILKSPHGFRSHLDSRLITLQLHIRHDNIIASHLTGSSLEAKSIVTADNIAIADAHMLATVNINPIIVSHTKATDSDIMNIHIAALEIVGSPGTCILQSYPFYTYILTTHPTKQERAQSPTLSFRTSVNLDMTFFQSRTLPVDGTLAFQSHILCIYRHQQCPTYINAQTFGERIKIIVSFVVGGSQDECILFQMQGYIIFQYNGSRQICSGRNEHRATARFMASVNRFLNSR